ncbi:hypothetical protein J4573_52780 [Actinomadura barringtoniae]|uniref:Uncharacterized protein n=1 Tax=Actinomadura barringtoniae TaxID=1427535 RepID=A0A939PT95_9ACTN|nr:hypothetical protein [Actinomadura barringtoniae]MBO2455834.1 hypothetical protein [Actinomadura barringtoniae]
MRDIRISVEAATALDPIYLRQLREGPDQGTEECDSCGRPVDLDREPANVIVYKYPGVTNVMFAHVECAGSALVHSDDLSVRAQLEKVHVLPMVMGDVDFASLVIAPYFRARTSDFQSSAHIADWLEAGLHLILSITDLQHRPPDASGWRASFMPGDQAGQTRVTVRSGLYSPLGPTTVVNDVGIRVSEAWLDLVRTSGQVALLAGLTEIHKLPDRDPWNILRELAKAFEQGALTCGMADADWLGV